jgi:hypothetical protein
MAFSDEVNPHFTTGAVAMLIAGTAIGFIPEHYWPWAASLRDEVSSSAPTGKMLTALEQAFPEEHRRIMDRMERTLDAQGRATARDQLHADLRAFPRSQAAAIAAAPDELVTEIADRSILVADRLADISPWQCNAFISGYVPDAERIPEDVMQEVGTVGTLAIRAAQAGRGQPRRVVPEPEAREAFSAGLRQASAYSATEIEQGRFNRMGPIQRCTAGREALRVIAELPDHLSAQLTAARFHGLIEQGFDD